LDETFPNGIGQLSIILFDSSFSDQQQQSNIVQKNDYQFGVPTDTFTLLSVCVYDKLHALLTSLPVTSTEQRNLHVDFHCKRNKTKQQWFSEKVNLT
jgi:hypothetical protein